MKIGLVKGRHEIEGVNEYIFEEEIEDIFNYDYKETIIISLVGHDVVDLYVTGLTIALVEVIKYCIKNDVKLTLYHYNKKTNEYEPQAVNEIEYCSHCKRPKGNGWYCKYCGGN